MSRILPSQAVSTIEALFPDLLKPRQATDPPWSIQYAQLGSVSATLAVLAEVPSELLTLTGAQYAEFVVARANANTFVGTGPGGYSGQKFSGDFLRNILALLKLCPDQAVPASTNELLFVTDNAIRESLRIDIAEVNRAIIDGEWKSATVVCGSVIEALLLWALTQVASAAMASAKKFKASGKFTTVKPTLEEWDLYQYIEVAADLGLVQPDDTVPVLRLAKDFRNLIHPGRSLRFARRCDQPTALAAVAGLGFLIRDLTTWALGRVTP